MCFFLLAHASEDLRAMFASFGRFFSKAKWLESLYDFSRTLCYYNYNMQ
jgi:hypothetical protein